VKAPEKNSLDSVLFSFNVQFIFFSTVNWFPPATEEGKIPERSQDMSLKTGWIEKRQHERTAGAWQVTYQMVGQQEAEEIRRQPHFQDLKLAKENTLGFHAITRDISQGGLSIVGEQALKAGAALLLYLHHHLYKPSLVVVAEVVHQEEVSTAGSAHFRSGLRILAVDQQSLDRMIQSI
jgi:hypothetical protein